jgi:hypothetical protein
MTQPATVIAKRASRPESPGRGCSAMCAPRICRPANAAADGCAGRRWRPPPMPSLDSSLATAWASEPTRRRVAAPARRCPSSLRRVRGHELKAKIELMPHQPAAARCSSASAIFSAQRAPRPFSNQRSPSRPWVWRGPMVSARRPRSSRTRRRDRGISMGEFLARKLRDEKRASRSSAPIRRGWSGLA